MQMTMGVPMATNYQDMLKDLGWESELHMVGCNHCGLTFMQTEQSLEQPCLHCGSTLLEEMMPDSDQPPHWAPAELALPLRLTRQRAQTELAKWRNNFRFPSADLTDQHLNQRLRLMYAPAWLMDTTLETKWAADVGFDYDVISHKEKLQGSQWSTQQVKRTKKDWEGRAGTLTLRYDNLPADAIERESSFWPLVRLVGSADRFVSDAAKQTAKAGNEAQHAGEQPSFVLPSRIPADAVTDMLPLLMERAKVDVQAACRADHVRNFNWAPTIQQQNWTQMLIPVWSTWYLDEDNRRRMVFVHGTTGNGWGERIPSMRRAWRVGMFFFAAALALIIIGAVLGFASGNWASFGGLGFLAVFLIGLPFLMVLWVSFQKGKDNFFGRF